MVEKMGEAGRLGAAARVLTGDFKVAELGVETLEELRRKHPVGPVYPFVGGPGPAQGHPPKAQDINDALNSFKFDTSSGISGWTVPLLKIACRSPRVVAFLVSLTAGIGAKIAPGKSMLLVSRIKPLLKPDGAIRPIVVGDLTYRLCTKALLRKSMKPDFAEPFQSGVDSKGGVEPIVRAVERALDAPLDLPYTRLVSICIKRLQCHEP